MKTHRLFFLTLIIFSLMIPQAFAQPWTQERDQELHDLRTAVGAYLLLDQLQLTAEQKTAMIAKLDEIRTLQGDAEKTIQQVRETEKQHLRAMLQDLKSGKSPDSIHEEVKDVKDEHRQQLAPMRLEVEKKIAELLDILTEEQMDIARTFNPKPQMMRGLLFEPGDDGETVLERVRSMSQEDFDMLKQHHELRRDMRKGRGKGPGFGPQGRFIELMEQVRAMSDDEYEAKKAELAAQIDQRVEQRLERREKRGKRGRGMGSGRGMGMGMGPGPDMAPGPGMGNGPGHHHLVRMIILSDGFYEALTR